MSMEQISLLSGKIRMTDRDKISKHFPLSVLKFECTSDIAGMIRNIPDGTYCLKVSSYEIFAYENETASTLQTDADILIDQAESIIYLYGH